MDNRRKYDRYRTDGRAEILRPDGSLDEPGRLKDVSCSGAYVDLRGPVNVGTHVSARLYLEDDRPIVTGGVVVRTVFQPESKGWPYGAAVHFKPPIADNARALIDALALRA